MLDNPLTVLQEVQPPFIPDGAHAGPFWEPGGDVSEEELRAKRP